MIGQINWSDYETNLEQKKNYSLKSVKKCYIYILEDRGAKAPLILAPVEGYKGPKASPNTINEFLSLSICFLIPNMLKFAQKWLK